MDRTQKHQIEIREETGEDIESIREVNLSAFETSAEADLVDALRGSGCTFLSIVVEVDGRVIGHILFTPVELSGAKTGLRIMGLAPMAVLPEHQRQGVGSRLVESGLKRLQETGCDAVVLLGHPTYYPRFDFVPASRFGITSEYDAPDEAFMALELHPGALDGSSGTIRFHPAFAGV